jgi:hypothetical protein
MGSRFHWVLVLLINQGENKELVELIIKCEINLLLVIVPFMNRIDRAACGMSWYSWKWGYCV